MRYAIGTPYDLGQINRARLLRRMCAGVACGTIAFAFSVAAGTWMLPGHPPTGPNADQARAAVPKMIAPTRYSALLDPAFSLGIAPVPMAQSFPLGSDFASTSPPSSAADAEIDFPGPAAPIVASAIPDVAPASPDVAPESPQLATAPEPLLASPEALPTDSQLVQGVPMPAPRPPEFRPPEFRPPVRRGALLAFVPRTLRQTRSVAAPTAPPDNRNIFEKLFGMLQPSGPVLAYATPEAGGPGSSRAGRSGTAFSFDRSTAVYDIAAHTVYMPNGARLEAHSGLGARLDDPRHVNERNRGATPPSVYDLEPRAELFHGVRALRLNPVDGGGLYGRTGLLAHSYMLGPNGDSNGCVSFRDYNAFLQAYMNGEVRRLVVVARSS